MMACALNSLFLIKIGLILMIGLIEKNDSTECLFCFLFLITNKFCFIPLPDTERYWNDARLNFTGAC